MSEMTQCNRCRLKDIRKRAKDEKQRVTLIRDVINGGYEVYVHPRDVKIRDLSENDQKAYWVLWVKEITDTCIC